MVKTPPSLRLATIALLAIFAPSGINFAQDVKRPPTAADRSHVPQIGWARARDEIGQTLRSAYSPGRAGSAGMVASAAFQSWLLLAQWAELLARSEEDEFARFAGNFIFSQPQGNFGGMLFVASGQTPTADATPIAPTRLREILRDPDSRKSVIDVLLPPNSTPGSGAVGERIDPAFLRAMTKDEDFLRAFFASLSDRDYAPSVLGVLESIWRAHPGKWVGYQNLAVALAIVGDQNPPASWPHDQVRPADVPLQRVDPVDAFDFWVVSNESPRLLQDLRQLPPEQLKFVVDAPVHRSELEWAQRNAKYPRADFGRAFSAINYVTSRLMAGEFDWRGGPYTLAAIRERGGICVDQAYFAMLSGKARGLPTLFFTGQGADGGHAWFGYLKGEDRWDLDCGRYENQNYAVGEALDPQTWLPISDHDLESLAQNFRRTPQYQASRADLVMARWFEENGDTARALQALDSAVSVSPRNDLAWAAKSAFLVRNGADLAVRRTHHEVAIKQFANNNDLKVRHQQALAEIARASGDESGAARYESQIISQNRRQRSDLSVTAASQKLSGLVGERQLDVAMVEYRSLLGRLGRTSGGSFFYEIVRPFSQDLLEHQDAVSAKRAVELARSTLRPEPGSILDQEFDSLEDDIARAGGR